MKKLALENNTETPDNQIRAPLIHKDDTSPEISMVQKGLEIKTN